MLNGRVSLKERLRIVEEVFTGEFTSDDYCQKYDISEATASADISKLIELKKLAYINKRRGRRRAYSTSICNEQNTDRYSLILCQVQFYLIYARTRSDMERITNMFLDSEKNSGQGGK